jgi:hypothetical protein
MHWVERGRGRPLVLLHGNTMMGLDFLLSDLVEMAADGRRVIVPGRPGYGYSDRPRGRGPWSPEAQARVIAGLQAGRPRRTPGLRRGSNDARSAPPDPSHRLHRFLIQDLRGEALRVTCLRRVDA